MWSKEEGENHTRFDGSIKFVEYIGWKKSCRLFETGRVLSRIDVEFNKILMRIKSERVRVMISIFCLSRSEKLDEIRWKEKLLVILGSDGRKERECIIKTVCVRGWKLWVCHFLNSKMK